MPESACIPVTMVKDVLVRQASAYEGKCADLSGLVNSLKKDNRSLTRNLAEVKTELATLVAKTALDSIAASTRPIITSLLGEAYNQQRTLQRHTKEIVAMIEQKCGPDNTIKQIELATAVSKRLSSTMEAQIRQADTRELETLRAIVGSLRLWYESLQTVQKGRYDNVTRAAFQAVNSAVSLDLEYSLGGGGQASSIRSRAAVLNIKVKHLHKSRRRFEAWVEGDQEYLLDLRAKLRADCTPDEVVDYVLECWASDDYTRPSENEKDVLQAQVDRKHDKTLYRVRLMEKQKYKIVADIVDSVQKKFCADYEYADGVSRDGAYVISGKFVAGLMPFFVHVKARELCLCHYHLEWD